MVESEPPSSLDLNPSASAFERATERFRKQRDDAEQHRAEMSDQLWECNRTLLMAEGKIAALEERLTSILSDNHALHTDKHALQRRLADAEQGLERRTADWNAAQKDRDDADDAVKQFALRMNHVERALRAARRIDGVAGEVYCEGTCDEMGCRGHAPSEEIQELRAALGAYDTFMTELDLQRDSEED